MGDPAMPLYDEFYKTAESRRSHFLHASASVTTVSFVILRS